MLETVFDPRIPATSQKRTCLLVFSQRQLPGWARKASLLPGSKAKEVEGREHFRWGGPNKNIDLPFKLFIRWLRVTAFEHFAGAILEGRWQRRATNEH